MMALAAEKGEEIPLSPFARCVASAPPIAHRYLLAHGFLVALATRSAIPRSPARRLSIAVSGGRFRHLHLVVDLSHRDERTITSQITHKTNPWLGHIQHNTGCAMADQSCNFTFHLISLL